MSKAWNVVRRLGKDEEGASLPTPIACRPHVVLRILKKNLPQVRLNKIALRC